MNTNDRIEHLSNRLMASDTGLCARIIHLEDALRSLSADLRAAGRDESLGTPARSRFHGMADSLEQQGFGSEPAREPDPPVEPHRTCSGSPISVGLSQT